MSVEEIIAEIRRLNPVEQAQVRHALKAARRTPSQDAEVQRRLAEARRMLDEGWCHTGGRALSEGIDEALYGEDAGPMVG